MKNRFGFRITYALGIVLATVGLIEHEIVNGMLGLILVISSAIFEDIYEGRKS